MNFTEKIVLAMHEQDHGLETIATRMGLTFIEVEDILAKFNKTPRSDYDE